MSDLRSKKCLVELAEAYRARAKKAEAERDRLRDALKICLGELQAPTSGVRGYQRAVAVVREAREALGGKDDG